MEDCVARALVCLPLGDQAAEALVEKLFVDDNIVSHFEGAVEIGPSNGLTVARGVVEERGRRRVLVKVAESKACDAGDALAERWTVLSRGCALHLPKAAITQQPSP